MVQRKRCISMAKRYFLGLVTVIGVAAALWCQPFVSLADSTGTVTAGSAKIREKADITSEPVGSVSQGDKVTIRDEVQDDSGTLWYQVYVDANTTGYIRSDLVSKQDGGNASENTNGGGTGSDNNQSSDTQNEDQQPASGATVAPDSAMDAQYAAVSVEAINVRKAPSTREGVVDRLTKDAQVVVSGQSNGSDGKVWYYVSFTGTDGAEKTGYIRSDLLTLGDMVPIPEEEPPEPQETAPEPVKPMNNDYELTWEQDEDGSYVWYLYDYTEGQNGYRQKLQPLLDAAQTQNESEAADTKTLVRQRVVIVILIFLIALLIAVIVIMALKLRDVYYEEYEDEEEEEQEQETPTRRSRRPEESGEAQTPRRRRTEEAEEARPQRRRRSEEAEEPSVRRRRRMEDTVDEKETERPSVPVNSSPKRKTKNFLLDDDEFEFEFLSMDDKD